MGETPVLMGNTYYGVGVLVCMDKTTTVQTGIDTDDDAPDQVHPRVNPDNHRVRALPDRFQEGDVLARVDAWADKETSHWVVKDAEIRTDPVSAGYRYRIVEAGGDGAMFISHGEIQLLAARGDLRTDAGGRA